MRYDNAPQFSLSRIEMNIYVLTVFVVFASVAASSENYNPCKDGKHGDDIYFKKDPRDCTKYYVCHGQIAHHFDCAPGLSFDSDMHNGDGGCNYKDPRMIPDCYSEE